MEFNDMQLAKLETKTPFRNFDRARHNRWKKYFEDMKNESGELRQRDLKHDPVLQSYNVSEGERKYRRYLTECLMDNCQIQNEKTYHAIQSGMMEATVSTSNVATFTQNQLALVRKIWPRLFAWEIVGVRSMPQPTMKVHTLDFRYASSGGVYSSGTSIYANEDKDYSDDLGEGVEPRKLGMNLTAATLTAVAKKLITDWSVEAEQDLDSQHNLSLSREMMNIMAAQIERERNREVIDGVVAAATTNTNWASTQPSSPSPWTNATPRQYAESLWDAIRDANKQIFNRIYRDGNVLVCGSDFANRLEKLNGFSAIGKDSDYDVMNGPNLFGMLNKQIKVFKDPFFRPADKAVLVHKSNEWLYTGYLHLLYVPLWFSPQIPATTFTFSRGMMTRYVNYAKNGDFFATITVT